MTIASDSTCLKLAISLVPNPWQCAHRQGSNEGRCIRRAQHRLVVRLVQARHQLGQKAVAGHPCRGAEASLRLQGSQTCQEEVEHSIASICKAAKASEGFCRPPLLNWKGIQAVRKLMQASPPGQNPLLCLERSQACQAHT